MPKGLACLSVEIFEEWKAGHDSQDTVGVMPTIRVLRNTNFQKC
jgi:hypothetical protein